MQSTLPKNFVSTAIAGMVALATTILLTSGCFFAQTCTQEKCYGPLNILIERDLVPDDASVELIVNGKVLACSDDYSKARACHAPSEYDGMTGSYTLHYEVKSLPKAISIRILSADGEEITRYDETPVYVKGNTGSCSTECHKNATIHIGNFENR